MTVLVFDAIMSILEFVTTENLESNLESVMGFKSCLRFEVIESLLKLPNLSHLRTCGSPVVILSFNLLFP